MGDRRRWPSQVHQKPLVLVTVIAMLSTLLAVVVPPVSAHAAGTVLFENSFRNRTVDGTGTVNKPTSTSGPNAACLTANGNSATLPLLSCGTGGDVQGAGKLQLTYAGGSQIGGVIGGASFPTSNGLDVTFNSYQWYNASNGADGIAFLLAAVDPANPAAATNMGPSGGSLGYSPALGVKGLPNAYLGVGLDVFGNFSNPTFQGTGCPTVANITAATSGAVVVRGPGNNSVGYCGLTTSYDGTAGSKLALRASTRAASAVPVQVLINPTTGSFTSDSGQSVSAGTYKVVVTPVGGSAKVLSGPLPSVASTLYPSTTWLNSDGIPKQLSFGFAGSTGGSIDNHEIDMVKVLTFNPVPQLGVSTVSYAASTSAPGDPVSYVVSSSVLTGANETSPISVTQTVPTGVKPVGAYGTGWVCATPVLLSITCTTSASNFTQGTTLPVINVVAIVTATGVTAATIQNSSTVRASSADANPGTDTKAAAGTRPTAPSNITLTPAIGSIAGGESITVNGTSTVAPTAIEIGTTAEQQAGTPAVILPCPSSTGASCFSISGTSVIIASMPARASAAAVTLTFVTLGIAGTAGYTYADKPATIATPTATAGITSTSLTWVAPSSNGSPITSYVVTPWLNGVAQTPVSFDASPTTRSFTGLVAGGSYRYSVAAVNAYGTSTGSAQSVAVVPYNLPAAPTVSAVSAGTQQATLTWNTPATNGSAVSGYTVVPYIGTTAQTAQTFNSTITTQNVTGLTAGVAYTFTVAAINAAGTGPPSAKSSAVTPNSLPTLTFAAPPAGEVNVAYSTTLTITNGTSPFVWSVSTGTLPAGLTLNTSSGLLSGTPSGEGSFPLTIRVVDASGQAATKTVTLVIAAAPVMTFAPANGEVSLPYSAQPTIAGGTGPFTWAISTGSLPAGLSVNATTGLVTGTPTVAGAATFTIRATDSFGQATTKTVTLTVVALPTFPAGAPDVGQVGVSYAYTFAVTGGSLPLTWSISAGSLPSGLTLNTTTGVLSGTPNTVGSSAFTVRAVDGNAQATTKAVTVVVSSGPLIITKTANVSSAAPGGTAVYTITIANTSSTAFSGVQLSDPLTAVLDDAVYNANASASTGTVSYNAPNLAWTGNVAANSTVTITYSVTVSNPDTGNKVLANTVDSSTLGTNCPSGGSDTRCTATVTVAGLTIVKTPDVATTTPGSRVRFSIVVTNSGQTAYSGATFTDGLAGTLDDATYNADATATSGSVSFTSPGLTWTGSLAVGASATVTYTVTVANPDTGDKSVSGTVVSATAGSTCPSGNPAPSCTAAVTVLVPALVITAAASGGGTAIPGDKVTYTVTISNNGQTDYTGIAVATAFNGVQDDATFNTDAVVTGGGDWSANGLGSLIWTGDLAIGATATLVGSFTVNNPVTGDKAMTTVTSSSAPGNTCPVGSANPACRTAVVVQVPALTISKAANATTATPGSVVHYTITVTNSGQTAYTGAAFTDALTGVLSDATYSADVVATAGTASYASGTVSWTGNLAVGASATITYSVTVLATTVRGKTLTNTVVSSSPFNNCPSASVDARCQSSVPILIPGLQISTTVGAPTTTPGGVVTYTIAVTNTGQTAYTDTVLDIDFSRVLDDAVYNADATTSTGSLVITLGQGATWTLSLAPGDSASGQASFTVNPPTTGDRSMITIVSSSAAGSSCPVASPNAACRTTATVLIPGLTITKTADVSTVLPGGVVGYTIVVANSGETSYQAATFNDSLASVLTDATYAGGATATSGDVTYAGSTLSWTGALAPGATATISYSVTVRDPDPGDKLLSNTVVSTAASNNCPAGGTDVRCTARVLVTVPGLTIVKTAGASTSVPGGVVSFTITATNSGATSYTGATFTDPLTAGVLDDATDNGNASATVGSVGVSGGVLTWTGDLAVGASATVTYSVTVNAADVGDDLVTSTVTSTTRGNNCAAASSDPRCTVNVPVARLTLAYGEVVPTVQPGGTVNFTATYSNTGQVPYVGISVDVLADEMADDVTSGDQSASSGTFVVGDTGVTWTGDIAVGATVTATGSVVVFDPDPGNKILGARMQSTAPGNNCPAATVDPRCSVRIDVVVPGLTITKTANTPIQLPGGQVGYTITVKNTGQTAYTGATVTDPLAGLLDDATYDGNAAASIGAVALAGSTLTWTGNLAIGDTATIAYSVTILAAGTGDKTMVNIASSTDVGSTCPPSSTSAACRATVVVLTPALTIQKTADVANATLGSKVTYTINVANTGQTAQPSAAFADSLAGVNDDATYNADLAVTGAGSASAAAGVISWSGSLNPGDAAVITYSVQIGNPDPGDLVMSNTVTSSSPGNNCPTGGGDSRCTAVVAVTNLVSLTFTKTASVASAVAGQVVTYTVAVTNSTASAVPANFTDSLADVLDDSTFTGSATASVGTATFASPDLSWSGTVPAGATATITYTVTLLATFGASSTQRLTGAVSSTALPGSNNCLSGSVDPRCTNTVTVASLVLEEHYEVGVAIPGQVLRLTSTFTNTGQTPYVGITISTSTVDGVDDVVSNGDQTTTSGSLVVTATAVTWTGDIPVGATVTNTGTITVLNPDTGNKVITGFIVSTAQGNNCFDGSTDTRCTATVNVQIPGLTITKTADAAFVVPGGTLGYTISVRNSGESAYVGATLTDSLTGLLAHAVYNGNAVADSGLVSYADPVLSWSGDLAVGQTATITFSVTALSPATGDKTLVNQVVSTTVGSNCPVNSSNAACRSTVAVLTPALTIVTAASPATAAPGDVVTYTLTVTNSGQTYYPAATVSAPLAGLLDDAAYSGVATATLGSVARNGDSLNWTGALAPTQSATISFSVTIANLVVGDHQLVQQVSSTTPGNTCPAGSVDARCTTTVPIASLLITTVPSVTTVLPTGVVAYTNTFTNTGKVPYVGISIIADVTDVADDADYNGDASATSGTPSIVVGEPQISWTGDIPVGGSVTFTASVTVHNPDLGNKSIVARASTTAVGSNCSVGSVDPQCRNTVSVLTPGLSIVKVADTATSTPGGVVGYTITVQNTGQSAYTAAEVHDFLDGGSGNAAYLTPVADGGVVAVAGDRLTWVGDLAVGQIVTITYSVRINSPDFGDKLLVNAVTSDELGSSCPTGGSSPACTTLVSVLIPALTILISADSTSTTPGSTVGYTVIVSNTGQTDYTGATVTAGLAGVLDDGTYGGDASSTLDGAFAFNEGALTWTGNLAGGQSTTLTYSVVVANPDVGNRTLTTSVSSTAAGSTCTTAAPCTNVVSVLIPGLSVSTTANVPTATPGDPVTFTITVTNTGETAYVGTTVSTDLSAVIDDATFNGAVTPTVGVAGYTQPNISWTGSLAVGASATITYSVRVQSPDPGNQSLVTTVVANATGSSCPTGSTNPACTATVTILTPALTITKSADVATTTPGGRVGYTIVITNTGQTPYSGAVVSDSLAGALTDSVFNADAVVNGGGVLGYTASTLTWTGDLLLGSTVTVTYSVTVDDPDRGDKLIDNTVVSSEPGSSCPANGNLPACTALVRVLVPALTITQTTDVSTVVAGSPVAYTVLVTNSGETDYAPATLTDSLRGLLDDATVAGAATATIGTVQIVNNTLVWSGALAISETATIRFTLDTVFPPVGDQLLRNSIVSNTQGSTCVTGSEAGCATSVTVLVPELAISKTADTTNIVAGGTVAYTIIVRNTGEAPNQAATLSDSLAGVLDDATLLGNVSASLGVVTVDAGVLNWSGNIPIGAAALITYSVTVNDNATDAAVLNNTVVSGSVGSNCAAASGDPLCTTSTTVAASVLSLDSLSSDFTMSGPPNSNVHLDDAVSMVVTTNNVGGYTVTVQAEEPTMAGSAAGNLDIIPIGALSVAEDDPVDEDREIYLPLSADSPVLVHSQTSPSGSNGDAVSNDYQVDIPFVVADTYTATLDYIVTTQ